MDMTAVRIRPITEADAEGFRQAVGMVGRERIYIRLTDAPSAEDALAFVRSNIENGHPQFVAEHAGDIVGWCDIVRGDYEAEKHVGSLGIGIIPAWRERGVGRRLIEATLEAADAAKFLRIELTANANNERAIRLYESVGFVEEGRKRSARLLQEQFCDVLVMGRLRLSPQS
ncbi:MAG: family N-acetyltransferase [Devosia sp.]|jgi:RimJ/RimL family protein N-acetyltransferase|nr:family N-acetyltransferase [Devosia sp.]